ncbi:copper exporting ATPase [Marinobacterium sp. xm-d-579]|uniref:heavy-metal-associated domain-containing protein n=1 Tax=Marinobacterium sp. xm-d-579 TaxID=2497734 RepID=UPI001567D31F|nr:copper exporting ATPase [Marinobacterium sp. xm-d-579]
MNNIKLYVEGMNCGGCVSSIQEALAADTVISEVSVELDSKTVSLATEKSIDEVLSLLQDAGYESEVVNQ